MLVERGWSAQRKVGDEGPTDLLEPQWKVGLSGYAAHDVLNEVAYALHYKTARSYNQACETRPEEVEARLKAL